MENSTCMGQPGRPATYLGLGEPTLLQRHLTCCNVQKSGTRFPAHHQPAGVIGFGSLFLLGFFLSCGDFFGTGCLRCHGFSGVNLFWNCTRAGDIPTDFMNSLEHMYSARDGPLAGRLHHSSGGCGSGGLADGRRRRRA